MHDDVLAHLRAFGMKVLLHPERAEMAAQHGARPLLLAGVGQLQLGVPRRGEKRGLNGGHAVVPDRLDEAAV
jgi:hypothetical protein